MASASTSKDCEEFGNEFDPKIGQLLFEQQVLLPLFTRIKHKGIRSSDFADLKQLLRFIFQSFKYQKRNYLIDIFHSNGVYDLVFERATTAPVPPIQKPLKEPKAPVKAKKAKKRPNVIVFKEVPWFLKHGRTEALKERMGKEEDMKEAKAVALAAWEESQREEAEMKKAKMEPEEEDPQDEDIQCVYQSTTFEQNSITEGDSPGEEKVDDLVKMVVETFQKPGDTVLEVNVKEEPDSMIYNEEDHTEDGESSQYIEPDQFVSVDYEVGSSNSRKRFSKNLEGHNLYYVVAKYYYGYWDIFKDWANRTAEISRKRAEAWNDIFRHMEKDGIKNFCRESLPTNFRKFVSKLRTKKRNHLAGTEMEFTKEEEEILEYENSYIRLKRKCVTLKD